MESEILTHPRRGSVPLFPVAKDPGEEFSARAPASWRRQSVSGDVCTDKEGCGEIRFRLVAKCCHVRFLETPACRETISASTHPRSVDEWLLEIDEASDMAELDCTGFLHGNIMMEFET